MLLCFIITHKIIVHKHLFAKFLNRPKANNQFVNRIVKTFDIIVVLFRTYNPKIITPDNNNIRLYIQFIYRLGFYR